MAGSRCSASARGPTGWSIRWPGTSPSPAPCAATDARRDRSAAVARRAPGADFLARQFAVAIAVQAVEVGRQARHVVADLGAAQLLVAVLVERAQALAALAALVLAPLHALV